MKDLVLFFISLTLLCTTLNAQDSRPYHATQSSSEQGFTALPMQDFLDILRSLVDSVEIGHMYIKSSSASDQNKNMNTHFGTLKLKRGNMSITNQDYQGLRYPKFTEYGMIETAHMLLPYEVELIYDQTEKDLRVKEVKLTTYRYISNIYGLTVNLGSLVYKNDPGLANFAHDGIEVFEVKFSPVFENERGSFQWKVIDLSVRAGINTNIFHINREFPTGKAYRPFEQASAATGIRANFESDIVNMLFANAYTSIEDHQLQDGTFKQRYNKWIPIGLDLGMELFKSKLVVRSSVSWTKEYYLEKPQMKKQKTDGYQINTSAEIRW